MEETLISHDWGIACRDYCYMWYWRFGIGGFVRDSVTRFPFSTAPAQYNRRPISVIGTNRHIAGYD